MSGTRENIKENPLRQYNREIFIFDHSTFKSHKYSSEHTSRILYVGRYFLNMEL